MKIVQQMVVKGKRIRSFHAVYNDRGQCIDLWPSNQWPNVKHLHEGYVSIHHVVTTQKQIDAIDRTRSV